MRTVSKVLVGAGALVLAGIAGPILYFSAYFFWLNSIEPRLCSKADRISTEAAALKFAQDHLRSNSSFWQPLGITESKLDTILAGKCCSVSNGPGGIIQYERWNVFISGEGADRQWFEYDVTFSTCGANVEVLKMVTDL